MKIQELIEKLQDVLFDIKETTIQLYEMSQPQSEVRTTVRRLSEPIIEHILKIILYGNDTSTTVHHWCAEICSWLDQCVKQKIKRNKKDSTPTEQELYKWLLDWYQTSDDIDGLRWALERKYQQQGYIKRNIDNQYLYNAIKSIYQQLCPLVANKQHTIEKIQEIIELYIIK